MSSHYKRLTIPVQATYEQLAQLLDMNIQQVEIEANRGLRKLISGLMNDKQLVESYDGDFVRFGLAIIKELKIDEATFVRCVDEAALRKYWVL